MFSLTPSRMWLPILAIAALMISYGLITQSQSYTPTFGELVLIFVNLLFLILAAVRDTVAVRTEMQRARRLMRSAKQTDEKDGKPVRRA